MIVKPSIRYLNRAPDAQIMVRVQIVLAALRSNPGIFTQPNPTLAALQAALDAFLAALQSAALGGPAQTQIKNARRAELAGLMRLLADYVFAVANGDMTVLLLSGLPYQKPKRTRIGPLRKPAGPRVRRGPFSGSLLAATAPVKGAGSYNWRVALASAPDVDVQIKTTSGSRVRFDGLIAGQVYQVAVNAIGAAGVGDWSEVGTTRIL